MDIEFILNHALNRALCSKKRIKGNPDSNKIAVFVTEYLGNIENGKYLDES
jgi:hypothetical protein